MAVAVVAMLQGGLVVYSVEVEVEVEVEGVEVEVEVEVVEVEHAVVGGVACSCRWPRFWCFGTCGRPRDDPNLLIRKGQHVCSIGMHINRFGSRRCFPPPITPRCVNNQLVTPIPPVQLKRKQPVLIRQIHSITLWTKMGGACGFCRHQDSRGAAFCRQSDELKGNT